MYTCAFPNCPNTYEKHRTLFTFHRFPPKSKEELLKKWLLKCGLGEDFDSSRSRICSAHFNPEDFERDLKGELLGLPLKKRLKENAEPCVDLSLVKEECIDIDNSNENHAEEEITPTFILEQLADVAVSRLDNNDFGITTSGNTINEAPVELIPSNNVQQPVVSTVHHIPSSLPASQNWPGDYDFNVSFSPQEKTTKGVSWTYSKTMNKLYVGKDSPCPINFSTNAVMPKNIRIRAMALYSNPESASEVVMRCVNHSLEEKSRNIFEAEHLVRCESSGATYEIDASTKRHSVLVPFENPPAGQHFSTYIFKFTCFGSCPFGPNRRPLMLVFTLEKGNQVIGRRKVDVKICACPGRDRKADEQLVSGKPAGTSKKRKEPDSVSVSLAETFEFTKKVDIPIPKKLKTAPNQDGKYSISVNDPECYEFLKQMKKLYDSCQVLANMSPVMKKVLSNYFQRKGYNISPDVLNP